MVQCAQCGCAVRRLSSESLCPECADFWESVSPTPVPAPRASETLADLGRLAVDELLRAQGLHRPMASAHEGYAVLLEELDELWDEVRKKNPDKKRMREEALQVAAVALRFIHDVTGEDR